MRADDPKATWLPSSNFDLGRNGTSIDLIILHTTEASFESALSWLRGRAAGSSNRDSSSHYLVSADGSRVAQLVREADTAWAAGNLAYNRRAINIEQEGYADRNEVPDGIYQTVGQLVGRVAERHHIPLDRNHVIGHMDVPDPRNPALMGGMGHHHDPGPAYDFERLLGIAPKPTEVSSCRYFSMARHNICRWFHAFCERYGDAALMTFGYPLSEAFTNESGVMVQYFERARFEWHPDWGQNPWDVLLGRIGDEIA